MNLLLSLLGWLFWNFGLYSYEKDKADKEGKEFPFKTYAKCYWDNWVLSLICVPILWIIGIKQLGFEAIPVDDVKDLKWNDLYYLGSGALAEILRYYALKLLDKLRS